MTKKIKFLESNPKHLLSFLNVTINKLYEITGDTDTHYKCVADDGVETLLLKLGSLTKYEIIEETKPVKKYLQFDDKHYCVRCDLVSKGHYYEIIRETPEIFIIKLNKKADLRISKNNSDFKVIDTACGEERSPLMKINELNVGDIFEYAMNVYVVVQKLSTGIQMYGVFTRTLSRFPINATNTVEYLGRLDKVIDGSGI